MPEDKAILVTGGGIGQTPRTSSPTGRRVVVTDVKGAAAEAVVQALTNEPMSKHG